MIVWGGLGEDFCGGEADAGVGAWERSEYMWREKKGEERNWRKGMGSGDSTGNEYYSLLDGHLGMIQC